MAEVALTSIAKSALTLFSSLAKEEALLLWNSQEELQRLQATIETIGDLLQDADKMQSKGETVLRCLSKLRNVMYGADDLFDSLASELLRKKTIPGGSFTKEVRLFFSNSNQVSTLFKVAHQVKSLRGSLDQIKSDMDLCGFRIQQPLVVQQVLRFDRVKTHSFVHQEDVIGREDEKDRIVNMLLASPSREGALSVVAVIGFGGLGKTTLAQLVYKDNRVKKEFEVCLWACINYVSDLEQVLIEIIASEGVKPHDMGLEKLQEKLRGIIGGKKFLLVIDDLWDENYENWSRLESLLRCGSSGKMLVTTRSVKVAECLDAPKCSRLELEVLSEENSWCLFAKRAFYEEEASQYPELEALGKKIVSRCGNVPLSINVVGSILRHRKREVRTWSNFLENELGRALSNGGGSVRDVLMVSYRDLHPNLKLCFAYCCLFPKDHRFEVGLLVRLWISQGYVETDEDNTQSLEEQGEAYFFYLLDRCFFQQYRRYYFRDIYAYGAKMHDLIHDVAIDVAKTEIMFIDRDRINRGKRATSLRHISVHPAVIDASFDFDELVSDPSTVRTILLNSSLNQGTNISRSSLDVILTSFRMLRTLNCPESGIESLPDSVGELIHLRYIDLSSSENLRHLPNSICKIHHLITLNLSYCSRLEKLPPKIEQLISLRHLGIGGCEALESLPRGLAALTSLVDLDRIIVHHESGGLGYLKNLNHLRGTMNVDLPWKALQGLSSLSIPVSDLHLVKALGSLTSLEYLEIIKWISREVFVLPSKAALQNLRTLDIGFEGDRTCDLRQTGIHGLSSLTILSVRGCKELYLCWETLLFSMDLVYLSFRNVGSVIGVEHVQQGQLRAPTMMNLTVMGSTKWVNGGVEEEKLLPDLIQHLSSLVYLDIDGNEKVRTIPKWLPRLKSLSLLTIRGCSEELKRRCQKEKGEDWPLISHITLIHIMSIDGELVEERTAQVKVNESLNQDPRVEGRRKIGWCGLKI